MATLRKAKRYVAPSQNVVAGPKAASCTAELALSPLSPTKDVSTRERSGPATHNAKHGNANLRKSAMVGAAGKGGNEIFLSAPPPPRMCETSGGGGGGCMEASCDDSST